MPISNTNIQTRAAFYHSLGRVLTRDTNFAGNEKYKSAHSVRSSEVWMDTIPYAPTFASASAYASSASYSTSMLMVGTPSNPAYLYPLTLSNYQTWFLDTGTPTAKPDGFEPSSGWVKPLISSTDVPSLINGDKSSGYEFRLYNRTGGSLSYDLTYYEVDYYSGLVKFQVGNTPIDGSNGLGFTFNSTAFQASTNKLAYVQGTSTGGPRAVAFQYIGQYLSSFTASGVVSFNNSNTISFTYSGASYSFSIIPGSLTASMLNTGSNGGATAGYVLSNTGDGNFAWIPAGSGTGGVAGTSGTSGTGTSGTSGFAGTSGTSGTGTSGTSGFDGTSGTSGIDGTSGTSGFDGTSGTSGIDGTSGTSGFDGTSGTSGIDGTSGTSGFDGTSGTSGIDGTSGTSGFDGTSGTSGIDGTSGTSGFDGTSGTSGTSGFDGTSGTSGTSGFDGTSGTSGTSGFDGTSGTSGFDGTSGTSGTSGISGTSGTSGRDGFSTGLNYYFNPSISSSISGYYTMDRDIYIGAGTTKTATGAGDQLIEEFSTIINDPSLTTIPGGNWNFEQYVSMSSAGGSPKLFVNIYTRDIGGTETLIASNTAVPHTITSGTLTELHLFSVPVPASTVSLTDRIVVKFYARDLGGKTMTLYFEDTTVSQVVTSLTAAVSGTSGSSGTSGTGFNTILNPADYRIITATGSSTNSALANNGLTYNGYLLTLDGKIIINTINTSGITIGSTVIATFSSSIAQAGYFDYFVSNTSASGKRSGTLMFTWDGSSVCYTDTSTTDLLGSTKGIEFSASISSGVVGVVSDVTSGIWDIRAGIRLI
jgi:hypothetical protein